MTFDVKTWDRNDCGCISITDYKDILRYSLSNNTRYVCMSERCYRYPSVIHVDFQITIILLQKGVLQNRSLCTDYEMVYREIFVVYSHFSPKYRMSVDKNI